MSLKFQAKVHLSDNDKRIFKKPTLQYDRKERRMGQTQSNVKKLITVQPSQHLSKSQLIRKGKVSYHPHELWKTT